VARNARVCFMCGAELPRAEEKTRQPAPVLPLEQAEGVVEGTERDRGQRVCPHCGAPVAQTATVCWMCEAELGREDVLPPVESEQPLMGEEGEKGDLLVEEGAEEEGLEKPRKRLCPACGAPVGGTASVCWMCGVSLTEEPLPKVELPPPPPRWRVWLGWLRWLRWPATVLLAALILAGIGALAAYHPWGEWPGMPTKAVQWTAPPTSTNTPTYTPSPTATYTPTPSPTSTSTPTPTPVIHVVAPGEVPLAIAEHYGISVEALLAANNLSPSDVIRVGQELVIPQDTPQPGMITTQAVQGRGVITHTVQAGEVLLSIAQKYGVSVESIMAANDIDDPELIRVGQVLRVPLAPPTATPTPTSPPTPTSTPGPPYQAPPLLYPPDGQIFEGEDAFIMLQWASVGILAADEWYVVALWRPGVDGSLQVEWTKATSWRLPAELYPPKDESQREFRWMVTVMQGPGPGHPVEAGKPLSPVGAVRRFSWR